MSKRHPCEAKIPLYRKHNPYYYTRTIQISKQSRTIQIPTLQSILQLLAFPKCVSFPLELAQVLIICALNVADLYSLLPQLPLPRAFAVPQRYPRSLKFPCAYGSHLGRSTRDLFIVLLKEQCVLVQENPSVSECLFRSIPARSLSIVSPCKTPFSIAVRRDLKNSEVVGARRGCIGDRGISVSIRAGSQYFPSQSD